MTAQTKNGNGGTRQWHADEMEQQLLQQLGKDHISVETINYLVAAGGKSRVLPILGKIAVGEVEGTSCYERSNAIYILGMMKDPAAVPWLTALLGHTDVDLQILAVRALGRIGGEQALEPVRRLYNGPCRGVDRGTNGEAKQRTADSLAEALTTPIPPALALEMRDVLQAPMPALNGHLARKQQPPTSVAPNPTHAAFRSRARS
jgi:hypothetical protein